MVVEHKFPSGLASFVGLSSLLGALTGCGGRTDFASDTSITTAPPAPPEGVAAPLWVPAGTVWMGFFTVNLVTRRVGTMDCTDPTAPLPTAPYTLGGFYLEADEVTNLAYRRCVEAEACDPLDDPQAPDAFPASLDRPRAERYCAWRGGRLPSLAQLRRALVGDAALPAPKALLDPWLDCIQGSFVSAECQDLGRRLPVGYLPVEPIRSNPSDVGPYGHYDLFGSQWELTSTTFYAEPTAPKLALDCARAGGPLPNLAYDVPDHLLFAPALAFRAFWPGFDGDQVVPAPDESISGNPAMWGARCAYP